MGGAVFVNGGMLTAANVGFSGNTAQGGNPGVNLFSSYHFGAGGRQRWVVPAGNSNGNAGGGNFGDNGGSGQDGSGGLPSVCPGFGGGSPFTSDPSISLDCQCVRWP
jgi:hypothetical protein